MIIDIIPHIKILGDVLSVTRESHFFERLNISFIMKRTITTFSSICVFVSVALAEGGKIEHTTFQSEALEKNMLGDSPSREVLVYLPPSYDTNEAKRYPVVYLCHGNSAGWASKINPAYTWARDREAKDGRPARRGVKTIMDDLVKKGQAKEMIVVMPNGRNKYRGSHYVNSPVTGNWADHIAKDLVAFIDKSTEHRMAEIVGR